MEHAQEVIADYEAKVCSTRHMDTAKIVTKDDKVVTMIIDHEYSDNGKVSYLAQRCDGKQKWVRNPDVNLWGHLIEEYWGNQDEDQYDTPKDEP